MSNENEVASQLLTTIGRSWSPSRVACSRTQRWRRRLSGPTPSVDQTQICSGVTKVAPGSSTYSAAAGLCPHQTRTVGAVVRSKAKRVLPPQASAPARSGAARLLGRPVGGEQEEGAGPQVGLHAAARIDDLGPGREGLGGRGPLSGPVAPAEVGQVG